MASFDVTTELAVSPSTPLPPPRTKSPPLAFAKTPNDSLAPLKASSPSYTHQREHTASSPHSPDMGRESVFAGQEADMQIIVEQQADALHKLHEAFAAERQSWSLERERLYQRISSLETLLKAGSHHSPAKSPSVSPSTTTPQHRTSISSQRLPSIAEDDDTSLSQRRDRAPRSIDLTGLPTITTNGRRRQSSVSFSEEVGDITVEEVPISPATTNPDLSPIPPNNRDLAGHTPLRAPRRSTPPFIQKASTDGFEGTPTRNNTHKNSLPKDQEDPDEDVPLKGPLNMPELPNQPDATNFTLDALSRRLERFARHPSESRPMIFKVPSPGLASPAEPATTASSGILEKSTQGAIEPMTTRTGDRSQPELDSSALSPTEGPALSQQESHERKLHSDFEQGGIRLNKKASSNFGAPFGQLGGFGNRS